MLFHKIEYIYHSTPEKELENIEREHIFNMIVSGYSEGELIDGRNDSDNYLYFSWNIKKEDSGLSSQERKQLIDRIYTLEKALNSIKGHTNDQNILDIIYDALSYK